MGKVYSYDETTAVLDADTPLVTSDDLTTICKEVELEANETEITMFISMAHAIVCEYLDGYGVPNAILVIIERYLGCHFGCITYPQSTFESIGKLQNSFSMKVALGFDQTRFGQQAKKIDPTGQLKRIDDGKQHNISISWLGMSETEKTVYNQEKATE